MGNTEHIRIRNADGINEWWIAFYISNIAVSISCNGSIVNVEISDNKWYENTWIGYDRIEWSYYVFETPDGGNQYTPPLSVRITREYQGIYDIIIGHAVIQELNAGFEYDFGDNFCKEMHVNNNTLDVENSNDGILDIFTDIDGRYYYVLGTMCLMFMIIEIFACLDAKCWRRNDYYQIMALPSILLQILDMLSDVYFIIDSFSAIEIFNSNMFGLDLFYLGLPKQYLLSFSTKRIYSIILLENVPQSVLSIIFLLMTSITFSLISIIVTLISMVLQKRIYKRYDYVYITIDIKGEGIMENKRCKHRMKHIKEYICRYVLGVNEKSIQIMKPYHGSTRNGLQLQIHISFIHEKAKMNPTDNYQNLLNIAIDNGSLQEIIQNEWKLVSLPKIGNISCEFIKSKEKKQLSIERKTKNKEEMKKLQEDKQTMKQKSIH